MGRRGLEHRWVRVRAVVMAVVAGALLVDTARNGLWREPAVFDLWKQALVAPALPASLRGMFDGCLLTSPQGATS